MKTALSILCAISVLLAQGVSAAAAVSFFPAATAPCRCCDCNQTGCCATADSPASQPVPAVPAPVLQHTDFQLIAAEISRFLLNAVPAPTLTFLASPDAPAAGTIPLFTRDCALLL